MASITRSAPGSANASAAIAEASMTLSGIAHLTNNIDRRGSLGQVAALRALVEFARGQHGRFIGGPFDQVEQLALERTPVALRPLTEAFDDCFGNILDGKTRGHDGSIIAPQWNRVK